ncbi:MAG: hypothetical protein WD512_12290, partial [Candidatus Paceibacterota bacterium]
MDIEWSFEKDFAGFLKNQNVKLLREMIDSEWYLICQSQQIRSTPGIKLSLNVPLNFAKDNKGVSKVRKRFCLEVEGFSNNGNAFLWVMDNKKERLIKNKTLLPEITANSKTYISRALFEVEPEVVSEAVTSVASVASEAVVSEAVVSEAVVSEAVVSEAV